MEYFYYVDGNRKGPVNAAQLKALAMNGNINENTIIECGDKVSRAGKIKGLTFKSDTTEDFCSSKKPETIPMPKPNVFSHENERQYNQHDKVDYYDDSLEKEGVRLLYCGMALTVAGIALIAIGIYTYYNSWSTMTGNMFFEDGEKIANYPGMIRCAIFTITGAICLVPGIILCFLHSSSFQNIGKSALENDDQTNKETLYSAITYIAAILIICISPILTLLFEYSDILQEAQWDVCRNVWNNISGFVVFIGIILIGVSIKIKNLN